MSISSSSSAIWQNLRIFTAVILAVLGGFLGIFSIVNGENHLVLPPDFITLSAAQQQPAVQQMIEKGLMPWCQGLGLVLVLVGVAYLLLGYKDKTSTNLTSPADED